MLHPNLRVMVECMAYLAAVAIVAYSLGLTGTGPP